MNMQLRNSVWELSGAYEQHNAERRAHVVKVLDNFGAPGYNEWPIRAAITRIGTPNMHPSAMYNYVRLGQQGIKRDVKRADLPKIDAFDWPNQSMFDVWFVSALHGNDGSPPSDWELQAYLTTQHALVVFDLGCNHTDRNLIKHVNQYRKYQCNVCDYTWGVDTSD